MSNSKIIIDSIAEALKKRAKEVARDFAASERGSAAVSDAIRYLQGSRRVLEETATQLVNALGLATKADLERVSRKVARLRKRMQALIDEQG